MHKEFMKFGTEAERLTEECSEVIKVCMKIQRFGLDDWNPYDPQKKTNRAKLIEEISDVENAIAKMVDYVNSVPVGTQRFRKDEVQEEVGDVGSSQ